MDVKRLLEAHGRLKILCSGGGSEHAIEAQLNELEAAINEIGKRPKTYLNTAVLHLPPHWKQWHELMFYAENPWVRVDFITICKEVGKKFYYAKNPAGPGGSYITDTKGRKRTWKHVITAMHYIDRDYPCQDTETWAQKDAGPA